MERENFSRPLAPNSVSRRGRWRKGSLRLTVRRDKRARTTWQQRAPRDGGKGDCKRKLATKTPMVFKMAKYPQPDTPTEGQLEPKAQFREKGGEELREFIVLTAYLYVCFAAVIYFKAAVLQAHGVAYAH